MLKIWHYLNYKGHFYLYVQRKANALFGRLWTLLEVLVVSQSCNMLQLCVERRGSVSPAYMYVLTILSCKILYKCAGSSSTVTHIAVSHTLK